MRVISQNGAIDVPYEITAFHSCNGRIRMNMAGDTGKGTEMAVYGSQEKALVVMVWLQNEYRRQMRGEYYESIFRFPADDEVME